MKFVRNLGRAEWVKCISRATSKSVVTLPSKFYLQPSHPIEIDCSGTRDGKRFLIDVAGEGSAIPIMLMVNWTAELKR